MVVVLSAYRALTVLLVISVTLARSSANIRRVKGWSVRGAQHVTHSQEDVHQDAQAMQTVFSLMRWPVIQRQDNVIIPMAHVNLEETRCVLPEVSVSPTPSLF